MLSLTDEDSVLLAKLVSNAQHLMPLGESMLRKWLLQISDHERALLVTWVARQGPDWMVANFDPLGQPVSPAYAKANQADFLPWPDNEIPRQEVFFHS